MRACKIISIVLAVCGAAFIIVGAVLGFKVLPDIIHDQIVERTVLKNGTDQYERFEELPFPLDFKVYFFNITNPNENVLNGVRPLVVEQGPYIYKKYSKKENIKIIGDVIEYQQRNEYKSEDNGDDEYITTINIPLLGVFQQFESIGLKPLNDLLRRGYKIAFNLNENDNPQDFFIKTRVKDFTFSGYEFCKPIYYNPEPGKPSSIKQKAAKILCMLIRQVAKETMDIKPDGTISFSLFGKKNGEFDGSWKMNSGTEDIDSLGEIMEFNERKYTDVWVKDSHCNLIQGGDSVIYPPFSEKSTIFTIFSTDICRTVQLKFEKDIEFKGVDAHRKSLTLDQLDSTLEINQCFCVNQSSNMDGEKTCFPKGFMDMKTCLGAEIILSLPHFLYTSDDYSSTIEGLTPSIEDHETYVDIEPYTGSPLRGHKRMQFNMISRYLKNMDTKMINMKKSIIPIMWVDEGVEITDDLLNQLKDEFVKMLPLVDILTYVLMGAGLLLMVGFGGYLCFNWKKK